GGKQISGVFAGLSVHLQPGRPSIPKMNHVEELYVDIGAKSGSEARAAGVDLLDPIALQRKWSPIGKSGEAGPCTVDRLAISALRDLARGMKESKIAGTTTIAFVTQQWTGGRGLNRLLTEITADEMIYVGRIREEQAADGKPNPSEAKPGAGVLLGLPAAASEEGKSFAEQFSSLADREHIPIVTIAAAPPRIGGYAKNAEFPERFVELGLPALWPVTPAEYGEWNDEGQLLSLLEAYLALPKPGGGIGGGVGGGNGKTDIEALTEAYGASGHEG